jgi:L-iditol 2-dehydrogenase
LTGSSNLKKTRGSEMKALVLTAYNEFMFSEVPQPELASDEVLVRVKSCGICGSDVHGMDGSTGRRKPPVIMGHEAAGVIESVGNAVSEWQAGDRVTFDSTIYPLADWYTRKGLYNLSENRKVLGVSCDEYRRNGAFAEYVNVPQHILYKIPEEVSFDHAAMVEPAAVALHAISLSPFACSDTVLVVGAGMIGLFIVQLLRATGAGTIIAIDPLDDRLEMARELGADCVDKPDGSRWRACAKENTAGRGADLAFDAVGNSSAIRTAIDQLRNNGCLTLVGNLAKAAEIPLQYVVTRQIRLQGSCAICGEYPAVLDLIKQGRLTMGRLLSATAPLSEGAKWFQRLQAKEPGLLKVVLNP